MVDALLTGPVEGYPLRVVLPGLDRVLWWGPDANDQDVVAASGGHPVSWATPDQCWAAAAGNGWDVGDPDSAETLMDLRGVVDWNRRRGLALDPVGALNAWNLAGDVARTTGGPWHDRSRICDACYDKLVAANLPYLFDRSGYSPRWTRRELQNLHRKLGEAITLITHALR
ncbi:hypothetical protein GCM10022223_66820 [Kineosporia mesophila]|uniref:Uncharacterized protein n=1 Tax=Kineosporia mesophila TaxID=566012 RepID=A0ABP7AQR4_9ACTN|nr:hypothetical protein [Kineosporia mesophila]MCD5349075.1 hypothetical protein [Kineosporia mesophila]